MTVLSPSKIQEPSRVIQSTESSMALPVTSRTDLSRVTAPTSLLDTVVGKPIPGPQIQTLAAMTTVTTISPTTQRYTGEPAPGAMRCARVSAPG